MRVYLAGPFFDEKEHQDIEFARDILRKKNIDIFVPMEHFIEDGENLPNDVWGKRVYEMDRDAIYDCDVLLAIYHGMYSDSGTAFEVGFARALNKKIIIAHSNYTGVASLMITNSADCNIKLCDLEQFDFNNLNNNKLEFSVEQK